MKIAFVLAASILSATPALAQQREPRPFEGAYAGVGAGYLEHHFALEISEFDPTDDLSARYVEVYRQSGIGGGAFAGYDLYVSPRVRLGGELEATAGGRTNTARLGGFAYAQKPQFGVRATARAGYVLTPKLMAYGQLGYGGNRYTVRDGFGIGDENGWGSSFIVGGGAEYRIDRRIGVRVDFKHTDNQTNQIFVGVPIRF